VIVSVRRRLAISQAYKQRLGGYLPVGPSKALAFVTADATATRIQAVALIAKKMLLQLRIVEIDESGFGSAFGARDLLRRDEDRHGCASSVSSQFPSYRFIAG